MYQFNVAQQLKSPLGTEKTYEVNDTMDIGGCPSLVKGQIRLILTNRSILVEGTLKANIDLTCSRCLGQFKNPLTLNISEEFFPTTDVLTGAKVLLPDDKDCFTIDEHNILDLGEAVRQYALLAIPMKPLCKEDCAGICPTCGTNRNLVKCGCEAKAVDPRWAALSKLKIDESK